MAICTDMLYTESLVGWVPDPDNDRNPRLNERFLFSTPSHVLRSFSSSQLHNQGQVSSTSSTTWELIESILLQVQVALFQQVLEIS